MRFGSIDTAFHPEDRAELDAFNTLSAVILENQYTVRVSFSFFFISHPALSVRSKTPTEFVDKIRDLL
jgi:hypothetical protein